MRKNINYTWTKGKIKFFGKRGTKKGLARDLIYMGDIKLFIKDIEFLDLDNKSKINLDRVCDYEWARLLEKKGWKWKKI